MDFSVLFVLMGVIGPWELVVIVLIILLLFGGKKIPELFKGIGQGLKEFKDATSDKGKDETQEKIEKPK
jgi:sec-independent protein translocase protein TatA